MAFPNWSLGTRKTYDLSLQTNRHLSGRGLSPYAAPSTEVFERISPTGAMQGCIALYAGAGKPLQTTPFKYLGAQDQSGIGVSFLLGTFLWTSKEKYLGCRAETRLTNNPSR